MSDFDYTRAPRSYPPAGCIDLEPLGHGGSSNVYAATEAWCRRKVALKLLNTPLRDEAQLTFDVLEKTGSPYVARVFWAGEDETGRGHIISEYLQGQTLDEYIRSVGALPIEDALAILERVAAGLSHVHAAGLVHRDLKPSNVFRCGDDSRIKLIDFGLAGPPGTPAAGCTPRYAAPEQLDPRNRVDERADIYALGLLFYEMATGRQVFEESHVTDVSTRHDPAVWDRQTRLPPEVQGAPLPLNSALTKLLATDPRDRPRSAPEAFRTLSEAYYGEADAAKPTLDTDPAAPESTPPASLVAPVPQLARRVVPSAEPLHRDRSRVFPFAMASAVLLAGAAAYAFWVKAGTPTPYHGEPNRIHRAVGVSAQHAPSLESHPRSIAEKTVNSSGTSTTARTGPNRTRTSPAGAPDQDVSSRLESAPLGKAVRDMPAAGTLRPTITWDEFGRRLGVKSKRLKAQDRIPGTTAGSTPPVPGNEAIDLDEAWRNTLEHRDPGQKNAGKQLSPAP